MSEIQGPLSIREESEHLLWEAVKNCNSDNDNCKQSIELVILSGYKDEPENDKDGKPLSRRTTPLHRAARDECKDLEVILNLFQIYNNFSVNYTDELGLTHFHVACMFGCDDVVEKFLELGQVDPNLLVPETGDSPLHLALDKKREQVAELLLRRGGDPNLANAAGSTALHLICSQGLVDLAKILFELSNAKYQPLQINARNNLGNTPLHIAMHDIHEWFMVFLLEHGADPNATNEEGSTPMHLVCKQGRESDEFLEVFFEAAEDFDRVVEVDAQDKNGRTPLQWAVANFLPDVVELLFDRGADLTNFVFPTEFYIVGSELPSVAPRAMEVVERLQRKGYELQRNDALTIMKFFAKYKLLDRPIRKGLIEKTRNTLRRFAPSLSAALRLPPSEVADILGYEQVLDIKSTLEDLNQLCDAVCAKQVCEKATRRFFRRWALDPLLKLTNYQLPILCCDKIMDQLMNKDLFNVCLATTDQSS